MGVTSYLVSLPLFSDAAATLGVGRRLLSLAPLLASAAAFTMLYTVVPNRRVPIKNAIAGGVLAAILFEFAKRGFAFYLTSFPTYEAIYGALAAIPIFLVWVYLSWVVTLLGAEFSCCLGIYEDEWTIAESEAAGSWLFLAFRLLQRLWLAQQVGEVLSIKQISRELKGGSEERLETILYDLAKAKMVLKVEGGGWALGRDMSEVDLNDLYRVGSCSFPQFPQPETIDDPGERAFWLVMQQVEKGQSQVMSKPLAGLFAGAS
jgi:membrane protein